MSETTCTRLIRIVADHLWWKESEITPTSRLKEDLGADSLDTVELIMEIEDEFEVDIQEKDFEGLKTPQEIADFIDTLQNPQQPCTP
jgi:acyl carrier protein